MVQLIVSMFAAILFVSGCANQMPSTKEQKVQGTSVAGIERNLSSNQFCLHVKYSNNYFYFYSENYAEGWVTDGSCNAEGGRRPVAITAVGYRYKGEPLQGLTCRNSADCSFSERNYGMGKTIECASASAQDGNLSARVSTDPISCP